MTTFIVTFNFPTSASFGAYPWTMRIDATCAEDAVKACVAAHPNCAVVSVKVAERAESNRATAGGTK
jgi:hypothetical protein